MVFKPGEVGNPAGRAVGTKNKLTIQVKEAIELAFDGIGGVEALTAWAENNPDLFYSKVWTKLIPRDLQLTIGLDDKLIAALDGARSRLLALKDRPEIQKIVESRAEVK